MQSETELSCLRVKQRSSHAVDADAIMFCRHSGEQTHDFESRVFRQTSQRERAVLASTPTQNYRFS